MKRKSKAYITIYALYMIFVLMIVIAFLIVQVKNIRTVNTYKYDYIQAKANAYSKVRIISQRKLFDEELKKNSKSGTFTLQIADIPEFNHPTKIDYYEEKDGAAKIFSFTSSYPDNNGSRVTTRMVYNRKNPFEKRIISEEKIDELLPEIIEGKKSIGIKDCLIFSLNDETYFVDKKVADEKYNEFVAEKINQNNEEVSEDEKENSYEENDGDKETEIDDEFLTKLVQFSRKEKNILIDSEDITILNDVTIDGVFIDKGNVYYVENEKVPKTPQITVNGILILKNSNADNYKVNGEYLSTKEVDIKFTEDKTIYTSKKYEYAGSYYK
ncbi:hypothetical protein GKG03_05160 [Finegoldia sp. BIOML-A3]|uniref:hypothetical protein n=1 Tax=unclassified Finegoldia TaxID=2619637 RepID=UPI0012B04F5F|nr:MULTISPECIES: hypothetical protein [unclassified Finegoldia]MSA99074.1 hypothetical protein [Finegoldia sp. BIOML-A3]MSB93076.1 hypothetical protein [Finegoldia sp. BIOML-A4]